MRSPGSFPLDHVLFREGMKMAKKSTVEKIQEAFANLTKTQKRLAFVSKRIAFHNESANMLLREWNENLKSGEKKMTEIEITDDHQIALDAAESCKVDIAFLSNSIRGRIAREASLEKMVEFAAELLAK